MARYKGWSCSLKVNGSEVLYHRGVDVNRKIEMKDVTTKNSGGAQENDSGLSSWESSEIELVRDSADSMITTLETAFENRTAVTVIFAEPSGGRSKTGSALISDFNETHPHDDVVRIRFKLTGTGALS
jgi:predicted secreted protein